MAGLIKALMVDVDGVLVRGRPEDSLPWSTSLEADLGLRMEDLQRDFFDVHWENIVLGRALLAEPLRPVLEKIAPHLTVDEFIDYWFRQDSRLDHRLLQELAVIRSNGIPIYLATNQEHRRAEYLMKNLGLAKHVDGIYYSAQIGSKKPSQEFFDQVASKMNRPSSELLLIDDSHANVRAAAAANWQALHWTGEESLAVAWDEFHRPPSAKSF